MTLPPTEKTMEARAVVVVHMEDPAGSGLAACNGMPFESAYARDHRGETLWMCTGCFVTSEAFRREREAVASLTAQLEQERAKVAVLRALVDHQAEDEGLWFIALTAPEAYLQQELRKLHAAIEDATPSEPEPKETK